MGSQVRDRKILERLLAQRDRRHEIEGRPPETATAARWAIISHWWRENGVGEFDWPPRKAPLLD